MLLETQAGQTNADLMRDADLFHAVEARQAGECVRFWECPRVAVIVGRSGGIDAEVYAERCARDDVPILRRPSGGGAVVVGPGCLNYSLVLSLEGRPELWRVTSSYNVILGRVAAALNLAGLRRRGLSDLALNDRKVSGNAQRRGRRALLHHGTLLCGFDTDLMDRYLKIPARQPAYRRGRGHAEFVANLPLTVDQIRARLARAFPSTMVLTEMDPAGEA